MKFPAVSLYSRHRALRAVYQSQPHSIRCMFEAPKCMNEQDNIWIANAPVGYESAKGTELTTPIYGDAERVCQIKYISKLSENPY